MSYSSSNTDYRRTIRAFIEQTVNDNQVVVFSKTYCPYCGATKNFLDTTAAFDGGDVKIIEIDAMDDTASTQIQRELLVMTGQRTVPSIWVNGKHIGGNDSFQSTYRDVSDRVIDERRRDHTETRNSFVAVPMTTTK
jgi:glutaredoxin 3